MKEIVPNSKSNQNDFNEKEKLVAELVLANKELTYQNGEKEKRAAELVITNKELIYQNEEKGKRAAELVIACKELVFQNEEKEKLTAELVIANKKLVFQNEEKEKRATVLTASELKYQRLFESAKDGIIILDAETGMIDEVNPFLIKLLGFSYKEFVGKTIWDIGFFKDIIANKQKFLELQSKGYVKYENLPLESSDGQMKNVEFVSNVYKVNNRKVIQCNIRDITQRKLAEEEIKESKEHFEIIFNTSPDLAVILRMYDTIIVNVNERFIAESGYTRDELIGKPITDIDIWKNPEDRIEFIDELKLKGYCENKETIYRRKDGSEIIVLFSAKIIKLKGIPHIISVTRDITKRKQIEKTLMESENKYRTLCRFCTNRNIYM